MDPVKIKRYDQDLFKVWQDRVALSLDSLHADYSFFLGDNFHDTLNIIRILNFLNDPMIRDLHEETSRVYSDLDDLETELTESFSYMKYYFPDFTSPEIYSYISGLYYESPVEYFDSVLIIALDLYLGEDFEAYRAIGLPMYMTRRMAPEYLAIDCMKQLGASALPDDLPQRTLLDQMILHGKLLYFLDLVMPGREDSLKIGYTARQEQWCLENDARTWAFLIEGDLLYSADPFVVNQFIQDGPFTKGLPDQSPGMIGRWVGWQIIRAYMKSHPEMDIRKLFALADSQKILAESRYKPVK